MTTKRKRKADWDVEAACPRCQTLLFDLDDDDDDLPDGLEEDGDVVKLTCPDCGAKCQVTLGVSLEFLVEEE